MHEDAFGCIRTRSVALGCVHMRPDARIFGLGEVSRRDEGIPDFRIDPCGHSNLETAANRHDQRLSVRVRAFSSVTAGVRPHTGI